MSAPPDFAVALITGASSGIGQALALLLAPRCGALVLVARRVDRLTQLAASLQASHPGLRVEVEGCDLCDLGAVERLAEAMRSRHGAVDLLVNNAGLGDIGLFEVSDPQKNVEMVQVNILAPTVLTRALLPEMLRRDRGAILNISSGFGLTWMPAAAAYAGTKHYMTAWSESLRCELAGTAVCLTQVCPGPVRTEFESVAGNPTGQSVPGFIELQAEACARAALAALDRDRALCVPGFWAWVGISLGRLSPRWLLRGLWSGLGRLARRRLPHVDKADGQEKTGAENRT